MKLLLLFLTVVSSIQITTARKMPPEKILHLKINEKGTVSFGRDSVYKENLAGYVQERLFNSYISTGKMYTRIKLEKINTDVPDSVVQVVAKHIQEGQKRALKDYCLDKYKKLYDNIDKKDQDKVQKKFPVLFQTDFQ